MSSHIAEDDQTWLPTTVQVTVMRGRGLRAKGKHGTSDVYTVIQLGKEKYSTGVAEKTTDPEWREECCFELQHGALQGCSPLSNTELVFTVMHRALIGMDVFMGQALVQLHEVFQESRGAKNQWFRLNSKTGKKEKERGEIQVSILFTRNNLTASMYDLVIKDKSASTFSKLKEHMKGKRKCNNKDSSSAVLPGGYGSLYRMRQRLPSDGGGEEDYEDDEGGEVRRSKMRTFFLRGKLRKSSDTRSSSSLASESSESSSRGGSLSPTAGISVVVSDLSNSPSNNSNLTVDNSPDRIANTSPNSSSLQCALFDEAGEISISLPPHTMCVNQSHAYTVLPPDPPLLHPAASSGPGLLHKSLPLSTSLKNLCSSATDPTGDGRCWSFDKLGDKNATITAKLEKSSPMLSDEHQEERRTALPKSSNFESEDWNRKNRRNGFGNAKSESAGKALHPAQEKHKCWLGSKDLHDKPSPHPVKPLTTAMLVEERRSVLATGLEKLKSTLQPGRNSQSSDPDTDRKKPLTDGAGLYYHLTHNELVSLLVQREEDLHCHKLQFERQKMLLAKREWELQRVKPQVRDLEDYIDKLLVRIMEQKPTLLQVRSKIK